MEITHNETNESTYVDIDELVINHGFDRDSTLIKNSKIEIELLDDFFIKGSTKSESSIDGLFAAGDIIKHDGKVHLIMGAFHDATNAVNSAKKYLEPNAAEIAWFLPTMIFSKKEMKSLSKKCFDDESRQRSAVCFCYNHHT